MEKRSIIVIDETIREGMQYQGVVFSQTQRETILEFQEKLGVDICQAGYALAHITEHDNIKHLNKIVQQRGYKIKIAGMGRASINDVDALISTGITDFHLHAHIKNDLNISDVDNIADTDSKFKEIQEAIYQIRSKVSNSQISIAVLDIGTSSSEFLDKIAVFFVNDLCIDILSLPDTSGIMSPDAFYNKIKRLKDNSKNYISKSNTQISVHCHNDLGMASANSIMGVKAGATVVELSVLGVGERNGIGDIFTVGKILKEKGYILNLDTDNVKIFREYYNYVSNICESQTGENLLNYNTPFFGDGVRTHVAGTHAKSGFGLFAQKNDSSSKEPTYKKENYYLNVLCGKKLVKHYLDSIGISYIPEKLHRITDMIKSKSAELSRRLEKEEIIDIVLKI
ncbi:MAG: hypothetical protein HQK72_06770 [Desulfamplus sp.]|nr:hypothetical protein [Desulfamplus sp.]